MLRRRSLAILCLAFTLIFLCGGVAIADPCSGVYCENTQVKRLYVTSNFGTAVFVEPSDGGLANLDCNAFQGTYLTLKPSHPLFKEIYSALLTALAGKKKVVLRVIPGSTDCELQFITINSD